MLHSKTSLGSAARGRFQYSLRLLFLATLLVAAVTQLAIRQRTQERQKCALVEGLQAHGALVYYDHELPPAKPPLGPELVRLVLGEHVFSDVVGVTQGAELADQDVKELQIFSTLKFLNLKYNAHITDDTIGGLSRFPFLDQVTLSCTGITDKGLETLCTSRSLRRLWLDDTGITSKGVRYISGLKSLRVLSLCDVDIRDDDLTVLSSLKDLEELYLQGTSITSHGMAYLSGVNLRTLDIRRTVVCDRALPHLKRLRKIRTLYIRDSNLTRHACSELHRDLPCTDIRTD